MAKKSVSAVVDLSNPSKPAIKIHQKSLMEDALRFFGEGTKIKVTIEHYFPQRSLAQNGVLHWYCTELAEELGIEPEDFKMMMKIKFLQRPKLDKNGEEMVDTETGEVFQYIPSSKDLTTAEMGNFIEKIRLWGLDFVNFELPLPDKNYKLHFTQKLKDHQI